MGKQLRAYAGAWPLGLTLVLMGVAVVIDDVLGRVGGVLRRWKEG